MSTKQHLKSPAKYSFAYIILLLALLVAIVFVVWLKKELPDISQLHNISYQTPLSIYTQDRQLLAKFGNKKRILVAIENVPKLLINAFITTEDAGFYRHSGVDMQSLARATWHLLITGEKTQGGSTITMQVARNFLLTREKTYQRKLKEIILSWRIEQEYSKPQILQMYLNKIYLGNRSYGVAAAAKTYYDKPLADLNLAQFAMLAGLPKAPSAYNPIANPQRALERRNYVLRRMYAEKNITQSDFATALARPITAKVYSTKLQAPAPYIAEMVRQEILSKYGKNGLTAGLKVYTTINAAKQAAASRAISSALHAYDRRHGYHSLPHRNMQTPTSGDWLSVGDTQSAHIVDIDDGYAMAILADGASISLRFGDMRWARQFVSVNSKGDRPKSIDDILRIGDMVQVREGSGRWKLAQIPQVQAAFVALDASNGAILALTGGFDFKRNKYNRAIQSKRQPGSGFKPIIYTTALENGYNPASLINDAPVVGDARQGNLWRPENYSKKFFGKTSLRTALRKSRNLISIRLLRTLGIKKVINTALRFGFSAGQLPKGLSLALGSGNASPLQMARVYSVFANGGFLLQPYFIERIDDHSGAVLFQATPKIACSSCDSETLQDSLYAQRIISPPINFLMNSLLQDVVKRGTATKAKILSRDDLAGKTGTTNEQRDAWFNGYSAGIVASVWLGLDSAMPLGRHETGAKAALPIWIDFMKTALKNQPEQILDVPAGVSRAYIDPKSGKLALPDSKGLWEFFQDADVPTDYSRFDETDSDAEESEMQDLF